MAHDIVLLIFDPQRGAMVRARWLGGNGTRDKAQEILGDAFTCCRDGLLCWYDVAPEDAMRIAEARYEGGATSAEVEEYAVAFPFPKYWWFLYDSF